MDLYHWENWENWENLFRNRPYIHAVNTVHMFPFDASKEMILCEMLPYRRIAWPSILHYQLIILEIENITESPNGAYWLCCVQRQQIHVGETIVLPFALKMLWLYRLTRNVYIFLFNHTKVILLL